MPCCIIHSKVDEGVDRMNNEGDDAQPEAGGGPLPGVLRQVRQSSGQPHQGGRTQPVDGET